jgi:hypothetical protein
MVKVIINQLIIDSAIFNLSRDCRYRYLYKDSTGLGEAFTQALNDDSWWQLP